jgi:hypothetical protein
MFLAGPKIDLKTYTGWLCCCVGLKIKKLTISPNHVERHFFLVDFVEKTILPKGSEISSPGPKNVSG